jgi:hypothetical protein
MPFHRIDDIPGFCGVIKTGAQLSLCFIGLLEARGEGADLDVVVAEFENTTTKAVKDIRAMLKKGVPLEKIKRSLQSIIEHLDEEEEKPCLPV